MRRTPIRFLLALALCLCTSAGLAAAPAMAAFGFEDLDLASTDSAGLPQLQAGSHPFAMTTTLAMNKSSSPEGALPDGAAKDIVVRLPEGFVGNPTATLRCPNEAFTEVERETFRTECEDATAVGIAGVEANFGALPEGEGALFYVPVYNLEPLPGEAARLGFIVLNEPVTIDVRVSETAPYQVVASITKIPQPVQFFSAELEVWGNPADPLHDTLRGHCVKSNDFSGAPVSEGSCPAEADEKPFLTLPRACEGPLALQAAASTWEDPDSTVSGEDATPISFDGCEELEFGPTIAARPTAVAAESPSGLEFDLEVDDPELTSPTGTADSDIEKVVVTLPEGFTTNPSIASGLGACTLAQYGAEKLGLPPGVGCPESSKVGTVEVKTPLLEDTTLEGSIYVAKQADNPFQNLLSLYMVIRDPELGILIRLAGRVDPDPVTGQLTTTFEGLPQLPFASFKLRFREGPRAPLITPATCGTYTVDAALYPYADPGSPSLQTATFQVSSGAGGAPCATNAAQLPNAPSFSAGTLDPTAGAYSPFVLRIAREDGSQQLRSISTTLPKGLVGRLAGTPYCSDAQIAIAESRGGQGQGALELDSPSCPLASELGVVNVGAGAGPQPYYVQGRAYLAGPYKGAPLSLAIITPAIAGPFDLGVVAVRTALYVDSASTQITAISDPLPTILHGLPLVVRSVAVNMSKPDVTLNPTNCEPMAILGGATSTLGQVASLSQYFQASRCGALGFKPRLGLQLKGATKRNQNPALRATLNYPKGAYANIVRASVQLPPSQNIDNAHINNPCTRVQFAAGECPPKSILGRARAFSPLLDEPLEGPVYFRANGGERLLPDVVADLNGQIRVILVGFVDSDKGKDGKTRIRTIFAGVPDAPVSKFVLNLYGGKRGLLINNANLCRSPQRAITRFKAQNGRRASSNLEVKTSCAAGKQSKRR